MAYSEEMQDLEDALFEYHKIAKDLERELESSEVPTAKAAELEAKLDALGAQLGFCDLDSVADHLIEMSVEDVGSVTAAKRDEDPRRRYKGVCVRPEKRLAIYLRDHFTCTYCGKDLHGAKAANITLDHVVANVLGGSQDPENLVTVCRTCNSKRKDIPLRQFVTPEVLRRVRRQTRRSYKRYHGLAKALLAQQFSIRDIRKEKIYLRQSSTNADLRRYIETAPFRDLFDLLEEWQVKYGPEWIMEAYETARSILGVRASLLNVLKKLENVGEL